MRGPRPSYTAIKISKGLLFLARDPVAKNLLPKGAAEWTERLLTAVGLVKAWELSLMRRTWFSKLAAFLERHTMPGQSLHLALRKRFFEDEVRDAIATSASQVLVVGAGFDTLSVRLSRSFTDVTFIEVDHPGTSASKKVAIEKMGALRPNLHFVGVDLGVSSLDEALASSGIWDSEQTSAVAAEGVLMYLDESSVHAFLDTVYRNVGAASRLVFTYLQADQEGRIQAGRLAVLMRLSLMVLGEPWRWGLREGELEGFLAGHGFRADLTRQRCDLSKRYLEPMGLGATGAGSIELAAVAERQSS